MVKNAKSAEKIIISKPYVSLDQTKGTQASIGQKGKEKKKFYEVNEQNEVTDDLTEQVQLLFYNDVHFKAINARMHTLKCETPDGQSSDQTFKIDTGADGNLMPISMFARLFPQVSLDALSRTIDKNCNLICLQQYHN